MLVSGVAVAVEVPVVVVVLLLLELEPPPAGDGFTTVVLFSVLLPAGEPAGATVSVFCSHAARSAALAMMQIYFFIGLIGLPLTAKAESRQHLTPALPAVNLPQETDSP